MADQVAASCSNTDIQTAIDAALDGDKVTIPAGSCTWTGNVTVPNTKGLRIHGAGVASTIITTNGFTLKLQTSSANQPLRVTAIRFKATNTTQMISFRGTAQDWRIDNNIFDDDSVSGVFAIRVGVSNPNVDTFTYGLIDNNQFINRNFATSVFIEWPRGATDPVAAGDWIWGEAAERGTAQAVYIEDNVFSGTLNVSQVVDCRWGAKYVLRYNTIHNPWISTHSGCTNQGRGPIWQEVYKNTFTDDSNRYGGNQIEGRSTSGIWYNNTSAATLVRFFINMDHERSYRTDCPGPYGPRCDGSRTWDENTSGEDGWRCLDQPGWGPPQLNDMSAYKFSGGFTWENRDNGVLVNMSTSGPAFTDTHLNFGRELFNQADMTIDVIANRPSTCSVGPPRGVFVSTDENSLGARIYICSATDTWTQHWDPLVYPHPLQSGDPWPPHEAHGGDEI